MKRRITIIAAFAALLVALLAQPLAALAIPRDIVLARGMVWARYVQSRDASGHPLAYGVPYSQSKYALQSGAPVGTSSQGWRTDCSGFVSMCLNLRSSSSVPYSTWTHEMATTPSKYYLITTAQLLPGDFMLAADTWGSGSPHVALWCGWANDAHTKYWALEQTSSSTHSGTIYHVRDYPGSAYYRPYRYIGIEDEFSDVMTSVRGQDRFNVAAASAQAAFPSSTTLSVPALVVASGMNWPDALGGSALAGAAGGPLLLTMPRSLPASTSAEITRLKPKTVYVLGGTASVSASVSAQIAAKGVRVVRLGGRDRYETAALAASQTAALMKAAKRTLDTVYLATGATFPDALAVSPIASKLGRPVLLTPSSTLAPSTQREISALGVKKVVILGGTGSVGAGVVSALKKMSVTATRVAGDDRYSTAGAVAEYGATLGLTWKAVGIASGAGFADALSGGVAQGRLNELLLLTSPTSASPAALARVKAHKAVIGKPTIYGGSVSYSARKQIAAVLRAK